MIISCLEKKVIGESTYLFKALSLKPAHAIKLFCCGREILIVPRTVGQLVPRPRRNAETPLFHLAPAGKMRLIRRKR